VLGPKLRFQSAILSPFIAVILLAHLGMNTSQASESGSHLTLKHEYFWDRNGVWNQTPIFELVMALSRKWSVGWEQEFDIVSGASRRLGADLNGQSGDNKADIVSGASKIELRHSESPSLTYSHEGLSFTGGLYSSRENDYTSISPSGSISYDLNERNTTLGFTAAEFFDKFQPKGAFALVKNGLPDPGDKHIISLGASVAQSLTPLTLVSLTGNYIKSWGYLGHPYNPPMSVDKTMLTEEVPDHKIATAISAQIVQGFQTGESLNSLNLDLRSYADDWGLKSLTADAKVSHHLTETTIIRLRGRYYKQGGTSFASTTYQGNEPFRTADIRFFPFTSWLVGIRLASTFPETWESMGFLPASWDIKGDIQNPGVGEKSRLLYQLYDSTENYLQGTLMVGLNFNL
jgi:hypothetical protein